MTYTTHRDTRETLQTLDRLDLDTDRPTEEDMDLREFTHTGHPPPPREGLDPRRRT